MTLCCRSQSATVVSSRGRTTAGVVDHNVDAAEREQVIDRRLYGRFIGDVRCDPDRDVTVADLLRRSLSFSCVEITNDHARTLGGKPGRNRLAVAPAAGDQCNPGGERLGLRHALPSPPRAPGIRS